jgi:hypothetical protein
MKAFKLISLFALGTIAVTAVAPVSAQVVLTKDADGRVYIRTGFSRTPFEVEFGSSPVTRRVLANECGLMIVRPLVRTELPSSINFDGQAPSLIVPSGLPVATIPRCVNGSLEIQPTGNFRTINNDVVLVGTTANQAQDVQVVGKRVRRFNSNACGVVTIVNSASFNIGGSILPAGGSVISTNGIATEPRPICRRVGENNVLFLPVPAQGQPVG